MGMLHIPAVHLILQGILEFHHFGLSLEWASTSSCFLKYLQNKNVFIRKQT